MCGNYTNNVKISETKTQKNSYNCTIRHEIRAKGRPNRRFLYHCRVHFISTARGRCPHNIVLSPLPFLLVHSQTHSCADVVFTTTETTYTTGTTILISHGQSRMSTDDTENDYMIEPTLKSGLNLLFYDSTFARARPARGRRTLAQGRMSIASGPWGKYARMVRTPQGQVGTFAMTLRSGLPTIALTKTDSNRAVSLCILQ